MWEFLIWFRLKKVHLFEMECFYDCEKKTEKLKKIDPTSPKRINSLEIDLNFNYEELFQFVTCFICIGT